MGRTIKQHIAGRQYETRERRVRMKKCICTRYWLLFCGGHDQSCPTGSVAAPRRNERDDLVPRRKGGEPIADMANAK